jgi:hypothetical protein
MIFLGNAISSAKQEAIIDKMIAGVKWQNSKLEKTDFD